MRRSDTISAIALVSIFSILGHRVFTLGYTWADAETLFFHSALVDRMQGSLYPVTSPLEPDDPLRYRFALHALAAGISANAGELAPQTLAVTMGMLMPLVAVVLTGVSLRLFGSPRPGLLASVLSMFGGSLLPWYRYLQLAVLGSSPDMRRADELIAGAVWHGNTLDMIRISPGIAAGFAVLLIALWLTHEAMCERTHGSAACATAALSLSWLGLMNETHFVLAAGGLLGIQILLAVPAVQRGQNLRDFGKTAGLLLIAFSVVTVRGGLGGGVGIFGNGASSLQMVPNTDHLGWVVGPPRQMETSWLPLMSFTTQLDTSFALVTIPILLAMSIRMRSSFAGTTLTTGICGLVAWLGFYPKQFPPDAYRFGQVAFVLALSSAPFVLATLLKSVPSTWRRTLTYVSISTTTLLIAPHLAVAAMALWAPPTQTWLMPGSPDYEAAIYLRQSPDTKRVLVPLGPRGGRTGDLLYTELYDESGPGAAMREILAISRHTVPLGHTAYFNQANYTARYLRAGDSFEAHSLRGLGIDWVYALPSSMSPSQLENMLLAERRGLLTLDRRFSAPGTASERLLFRVHLDKESSDVFPW